VFNHAIKCDEAGRFPDSAQRGRWPAAAAPEGLPQGAAAYAGGEVAGYARPVCGVGAAGRDGAFSIRFLALTSAPRANEVFKIKWCEIEGNIWTVPKARMKGRVERQFPLSAEAMAILDLLGTRIPMLSCSLGAANAVQEACRNTGLLAPGRAMGGMAD
jgi:hypothetical protein